MPSQVQLEQIICQCFGAETVNISNNAVVNIGQYSFRRHKQQLHLTENFEDVGHFQCRVENTELTENTKLQLPDNLGFLQFNLNSCGDTDIIETGDTQRFKLFTSNFDKIEVRFDHFGENDVR